MAGPNSPLERRDSTSARSDTSNVFADRFALDDLNSQSTSTGVADGMGRRNSALSEDEEDLYSADAHFADGSILPVDGSRTARSSIRKSRGLLENPFRGQEEEDEGRESGRVISSRIPTRQATTTSYTSGLSHYHDHRLSQYTSSSEYAAGPSHDYGRYAQDTTLSRTPTVPSIITTQSTGRQSLHGPAHPYNMYSQNVDEDMIDDAADQTTPLNGLHPHSIRTSPYRHDADNLSEQLPPYSEYPADGAPKHIITPSPVSPLTTPSTPLAVHRREPQSMSDSHAIESSSPSSAEPLLRSNHKPWNEKTWKEKRNTKFFGIKFGWIVLAACVSLFVIIVISGTIGGFLGAQARGRRRPDPNAFFDASPLRQSMNPLPVGNYQLQLGSPQEVQAQCVTDQTQNASWSCGVSAPGSLAIHIDSISSGGQTASLYQATDDIPIGYGTFIPQTVASTLRIVKDMDALPWGPAFQFQAVYTKTVVVRPDAFQPAHVGAGPSRRRQKRSWEPLAQPGEQPWYCYWNNTLVEGFIYIKQNSTSWYSNSTSSGEDKTYRRHRDHDKKHKRNDPIVTSSSATSTATTGPTCTYSSGSMYGVTPTDTDVACPPAKGEDPWSQLDFYPYVVKIEERRIPGDTTQPFCQKMQVLDDGTVNPVADPATGELYTVQIDESSPGMDAYNSVYGSSGSQKRDASGDGMGRRALVQGACHCQWMSGENR